MSELIEAKKEYKDHSSRAFKGLKELYKQYDVYIPLYIFKIAELKGKKDPVLGFKLLWALKKFLDADVRNRLGRLKSHFKQPKFNELYKKIPATLIEKSVEEIKDEINKNKDIDSYIPYIFIKSYPDELTRELAYKIAYSFLKVPEIKERLVKLRELGFIKVFRLY